MPLHWMDVTSLSFNTLLLLERVQLSWLPGSPVPREDMALALRANPTVAWYLRHKCPDIAAWMDEILATTPASASAARIRQAEITVMEHLNDWIIYVVDPTVYDAQPFHGWDSDELLSLTDFSGKTVVDIGSGTGRQAFTVAPFAQTVFAVEPVGNLRRFIKEKARKLGLINIFAVDGLLQDLPFPDDFADVTMSGHAYGDDPEQEYLEMLRVTKPGGMIIFCPGTSISEVTAHEYLVSQGFAWSIFEEPRDGLKRKYWKTK